MNIRGIPARVGALLVLILAIAIPAPSHAQPETGTVQGKVLDATANVGVAGAQV